MLEAGLGFAVKTGKGDFIGRDAVLRKREEGLSRRMVQFRLAGSRSRCSSTTRPSCATARSSRTVTSGNYGHFLGGAIGMGYVPCRGESAEQSACVHL